MIHHLQRKQINEDRWNQLIESSEYTQVFFTTWYLDACYSDWSALVLDDYQAIFPIAENSKLGIKYIFQPIFNRYSGVITKDHLPQQIEEDFLNQLSQNSRYFDFCLHEQITRIPEAYKTEEKKYQQLDLRSPYAELEKSYSENLRRNLKKANKAGLQLNRRYSGHEVVKQFKIHQRAVSELFTDEQYETLRHLMESAEKNTKTYCYATMDSKGEIQAGAFFIEYHQRILYLKGFTTPEGKKTGAMHYLFDQLIRENAGQNRMLDFGGSNIKSIANFFHQFGSIDCIYLRLQQNRLPKALRWLKR